MPIFEPITQSQPSAPPRALIAGIAIGASAFIMGAMLVAYAHAGALLIDLAAMSRLVFCF